MRKAAIVAMLALLASLLMVVPALADHDLVTLPGSNFEIDADANLLTEDDPPSIDWDAVAQEGKDDAPTGQNDDSFGQGTKEDTAVPTIVDGSIPNNKSDLKSFGSYFEENANGKFLNLYWTRVQDPTGTTNMDFELNQSEQLSGNGVTPVPTAGDALIQYDLASGGTHPELFLSLWVTTGAGSLCEASNKTPCWGDRVNLTSQDLATGSINTTPIPASAAGDGVGPLSARTFGEAQVDFDAFTSGGGGSGDPCVSFASAYLKSRSSDSFTAALKDFIAPDTLDIGNCGSIKIIKTDDATPPAKLAGAEFDLLKDNAPVGGQPGAEDTFVDDCVTDANGECTFASVVQGSYWVVETLAPTGHDLPSPPYQEVTVVADEQVTVTFVNPRQLGAIQVTKTAKHAAAAGGEINQSGVAFTIAGTAVTTGNDGTACVGGLALGQSYDVVETVPAGYAAEGETTKSVLVDQAGTCVAGFETVEFVNLPLTDITFSVESQIDGGTASDITCDDPNNPPGNESTATTDANGDGSLTVDDLEPSTYTCTVVIDP